MKPLTRYEAVQLLSTKLYHIVFLKKTTGKVREMNGTLDPNHMPSGAYKSLGNYDRYRPVTYKGDTSTVVQVWDVDINAWRSFDIRLLKVFEPIKD